MSRAIIIVNRSADRTLAAQWVEQVPNGTRIEFKGPRRSIDQNSLMWAMLTDEATQLKWYGQTLRTDDWKILFLDALKRETRGAPSLDGKGYVPLGRSSSDLSKQEMSDLIELIAAFGTEHNVIFRDPYVGEVA